MTEILEQIHRMDPLWIYLIILVITFGENLFPPFPGDILLIFGGYLSGVGQVHWLILLLFAYAGSIVGFMALYVIGRAVDRHIIQSHKLRWLPYASIDKVERWFLRHGAVIILINRFLLGVRSAIAIFSGMARVDGVVAFTYASVSVVTWNALMVFSGKWLGGNWQEVQLLLHHYRRALTILVIAAAAMLLARYLWTLLRKTSA